MRAACMFFTLAVFQEPMLTFARSELHVARVQAFFRDPTGTCPFLARNDPQHGAICIDQEKLDADNPLGFFSFVHKDGPKRGERLSAHAILNYESGEHPR